MKMLLTAASQNLAPGLSTFNRFTRTLIDNWIWAAILLTWCLFKSYTKMSTVKNTKSEYDDSRGWLFSQMLLKSFPRVFSLHDSVAEIFRSRKSEGARPGITAPITPTRTRHRAKKKSRAIHSAVVALPQPATQPHDVLLVLDVEATCQQGTNFDFPNEIIEFPVCLMRRGDKAGEGKASQLEIVDEFRSFVRPTWRPILSQFCMDLTGITQAQVDSAPIFPEVLELFHKFLVKNGLIDAKNGERLVRFCWCSDGPFDVRDFIVKQCFISKVLLPNWIKGDVLDVRMIVMHWSSLQSGLTAKTPGARAREGQGYRSLNIPSQLKALGLPAFEGRQHTGIDDSRNIARIVTELARRGVYLQPNTTINPNRRWPWMGKSGQVLEEYCLT